jgi:hypothetical protein
VLLAVPAQRVQSILLSALPRHRMGSGGKSGLATRVSGLTGPESAVAPAAPRKAAALGRTACEAFRNGLAGADPG